MYQLNRVEGLFRFVAVAKDSEGEYKVLTFAHNIEEASKNLKSENIISIKKGNWNEISKPIAACGNITFEW